MMSYSDRLRDPRWQKKRLEVMQRAEFECEVCGDKRSTLNVHHAYYEKGRQPWDYPADSLRCLCETCHERVEADLREIRKLAGLAARSRREHLLGHARAASIAVTGAALIVPVSSLYEAAGMGSFFDLEAADVWALRKPDGTVNLAELYQEMAERYFKVGDEGSLIPTTEHVG